MRVVKSCYYKMSEKPGVDLVSSCKVIFGAWAERRFIEIVDPVGSEDAEQKAP